MSDTPDTNQQALVNAPMPGGNGQLPISNALAEASPDSLAELFSRDPEKLFDRDIVRIVQELRAQRERWAQAEASGAKAPKATKAPSAAKDLLKKSPMSADELGL